MQESLDGNQNQLEAARVVIREAEYAAQAQREKIEQTENSLYGGAVSNPKELQDLQMEAESLKRHLQTLEDRLLEVLLEQEELQEQRQSMTQQLAGLHRLRSVFAVRECGVRDVLLEATATGFRWRRGQSSGRLN